MGSIASVDKTLSRISTWMTYVAFAGVMALAFLPARTAAPVPATKAVPAEPAAALAAPAQGAASLIADPVPGASPSAAPATPAAAAVSPGTGGAPSAATTPPAPPPDVWTPEESAAGLRQCVQLLAPMAADVAMEEPMKRGQCGTPAPLALRSIGGTEKVEFSPPPTMNCRLAASLSEWVDKVLQPAAQQALGTRIKRIIGASSYSCRNIYNNPKLSLSEHATGNAIDIAGFVTADGRTITVAKAWGPTERDIIAAKRKAVEKLLAEKARAKSKSGEPAATTPTPSIEAAGKKAEAKQKGRVEKVDFKQGDRNKEADKTAAEASVDLKPAATKEAAFLKRLHGGSCSMFATVLGPEANEAHRDHFHLDMKVRRSSSGVCH
ncbi:MAG: extensin family protein [Hyphomicrobium sp.]|nr:extensin family protein [Hyphomicrobium sp.]